MLLCVYKPPNGLYEVFLDRLETIIQRCSHVGNVILAGDFNVHLLSNSNKTLDLLGMLLFYNLRKLIDVPTRITSHSATLQHVWIIFLLTFKIRSLLMYWNFIFRIILPRKWHYSLVLKTNVITIFYWEESLVLKTELSL